YRVCLSFFFFFQAEDGIRDFHVTGVQTCALPIFLADMATTRTSLSLEEFGGAAPPGPVATILSALFAAAVGVPLVAGILHLFARLLGGKGGFVLMLQAVGFSLVISLLAAPFQALDRVLETDVIGAAAGVAGGVWQLVLVVMAVREMYRMSTTR